MEEQDIVLARTAILEKAVAFFKDLPEVEGIFLAGSLATKQFDAHSDIDLRVVVNHRLFPAIIAKKKEYPKHFGELLFKEYPKHFGELLFNEYSTEVNHICVSHFKPFNKLDIVYLKDNELVPDYWYSLPATIYYDPLGIINTCLASSRCGIMGASQDYYSGIYQSKC